MTPDLNIFGYSKKGANHTLAILNELSRVDSASSTLQNDLERKSMSCSPSQNDHYLRLLRGLPPRLYVYILVEIFFEQVNWQYSIIDRNYFMPQLTDFYEATRSIYSEDQAEVSPDVYTFPSLLFQVVGCAFQFIPADYDRSLDDLCMGRTFDDLAKSYSDSGIEMLALFEKENLNLISVQAGFLRITLLKSFGYVVEAYRMVGQVVTDSEELGFHLEDECTKAGSVENTPSRLWYHELRRRVMVNLWLWDGYVNLFCMGQL
jgi:Fungal specific transcription factor domain